MSTNDVPGANPANNDELAMGCWAEHDDGSLIFVESVEADTVVYCIFDLSQDPPVQYRDGMKQNAFEKLFSYSPKKPKKDKWTWHDKTPFPWERVMQEFESGTGYASAEGQLTAAERVARSLNLQAKTVDRRQHAHKAPSSVAATGIVGKLQKALRDIADQLGE